ncbi:P-loop NTPase fold protein [Herbaspirillum sp. SJZ130]|uniref:P-loop NTPase fold protein n=1 Tax=Herbaspirillum sp. SJZ130 TaxID=2572918 RepID=UPI0011516E83|nr:P-loop NTPase fold protein [Herbaspirillum sp. SJZ130]TQK05672.1 KAP-like P-loop domain-containing protein [Herbaspirillum sp. SJZ106]
MLWALRIVPVFDLIPAICTVIEVRSFRDDAIRNAFFALSYPRSPQIAIPILLQSHTLSEILRLAINSLAKPEPRSVEHLSYFLSHLDQKELLSALRDYKNNGTHSNITELLLARIFPEVNGERDLVAGYASDSINVSSDRLGISMEVGVLTAIMMAKAVKPPLAIGLFGNWGTGKSFFMQSMKLRAKQLEAKAKKNESSNFCSKIVQVEFNAWHYVDTNLWASLATFILDSLAREVKEPGTEEDSEATLFSSLELAKSDKDIAQKESDVATKRLEENEKSLLSLRNEKMAKELSLADIQIKDFIDQVAKDESAQKIKSALTDLGIFTTWKNVEEFESAIANARSTGGRIWALGSALTVRPNFFSRTTFILLLIFVIPALLYFGLQFVSIDVFAKKVSAIAAQVSTIFIGLTLWLKKGIDFVKGNLKKIEEAKEKFDKQVVKFREKLTQEEQILLNEIDTLKAHEQVALARVGAATSKVLEIETRLLELEKQKSLTHFLKERTESEDYRKHLGLVSTVRKDFEALATKLSMENAVVKVDRIILYIDDLDRCPADKVVDVLQAVHLLLAYPLFVVVVGVDSRWLLRSLRLHFQELGFEEKKNEWAATPQHYLEKIFQIPYSLQQMSNKGYVSLIEQLMANPNNVDSTQNERESNLHHAPGVKENGAPNKAETKNIGRDPTGELSDHTSNDRDFAAQDEAEDDFVVEENALIIREWEMSFAQQLGNFIPSPRAAKRLSNLYRILKARVSLADLGKFEGSAETKGEFQIPMLLLAILIKDSYAAAMWFPMLEKKARRVESMREVFSEVAGEFQLISATLRDDVLDIIDSSDVSDSPDLLTEWIPFVKRFSFDQYDAMGNIFER